MKKQEYLQHLAAAANTLWKLIDAHRLDADVLFRSAGVDPALLDKPGARIACSKMNHLWDLVSQRMNDPCFAVHAGEHWHPSYLNALGYTWLVSRTIKDALEKLCRYSRVVSDSLLISLKEDSQGLTVTLKYHPDGPHHPARRMATLSGLMEMCRINYGTNLNPIMVYIKDQHPSCEGPYQEYFRSDVTFGAASDQIIFSSKDAYKRLPSANTQLEKVNDQIIVKYLSQLNDQDIVQQVKLKITQILSTGNITDDIVAPKLNMSVRSLQRKLQQKGTTFRALLDQTRKELSIKYIEDHKIRFEEIAFLTGFSAYSSFSRAFKRWTNHSPSQIRKLSAGG